MKFEALQAVRTDSYGYFLIEMTVPDGIEEWNGDPDILPSHNYQNPPAHPTPALPWESGVSAGAAEHSIH